MSCPVVFLHVGNSSYLQHTIPQAVKWENNTILLGDSSNQHLSSKDISYYPIGQHMDGVELFAKRYIHMHPGHVNFELLCYTRWIILANYAYANSINNLVYLDSDTMTFCNYEEKQNLLGAYETAALCIPNKQDEYRLTASGCISYWTLDGLMKFKDFLLNAYIDTKYLTKLKEKAHYHQSNNIPGGVCDMTLVYLFSQQHNVRSINRVFGDNSTFDQNIFDSENDMGNEYDLTEHGFKNYIFRNKIPFCYNNILNKDVRINASANFANTEKNPLAIHRYQKQY